MTGRDRGAGKPGRTLVTGGAGFIGSHLCARLIDEGRRVWALDSFERDSRRENPRRNLDGLRGHDHFQFVEGDVRDRVLLDGLLSDVPFDCVVHLAAHPEEASAMADPWRCLDVNVNGTLSLLESMRRHQVGHLVIASTHDAVRGVGGEDQLSTFAASKRAVELIAHVYAGRYGLSARSVRIGSVYGPRQRADQRLSELCRAILGDEQILLSRDESIALTYVDDVVDALVASIDAIEGRGPGFTTIDLGNTEAVLVPDLARALGRHLGMRARVRLRPTRSRTVDDASAVEREPRFLATRTDLETGLGQFASWVREVEGAVSTGVQD